MLKPISIALDAMTPRVRAELMRPVQSYDPRAMQLGGGEPKWYVFEIMSRDVEAELIKRRFGVYVPECEETIIRRGKKVDRRSPLFPGYVLVFMWETDENWSKIVNMRGVIGSVGVLSEEDVDQIRLMENCERPITLQYFEETETTVVRKKKRWRKSRKSPRIVSVPDEIVRTRAWSAFDDIVHNLDGEGRSEALRQMLAEKVLVP